MQAFFDINNIFFTVLGYPMSYVEFFGTALNILSVWLVARNKILNWPVGIVGVVLFGALYWQIHLYSDFLEQIYYLFTGFWGWWAWSRGKNNEEKTSHVTSLQNSARLFWCGTIIIGTLALGYITAHLHLFAPGYFPVAASFPYLDAFTTVLSFVATIFLVRKQIESWLLWIAVDIIGIWLYWVKEVRLVALLYVLFLIMATQGLFIWFRLKRSVTLNQQP
ncbi:MAG: nicotinamide riboside transporter PnuC [Candidatus Paceibacterota bacterium]|jgi:nicotinamide mononucleotide transporter